MKIRYVAPIDKRTASHRYRALIPGGILASEGHEISVGVPEDGHINVYSKHFNTERNLEGIRSTGGVFDVCDDHFNTPQLSEYYRDMCLSATMVTCNSSHMADIIEDETGVPADVIPDPYEFDEIDPHFWDLSMALWFGHRINMNALKDVELDCDLEVVSAFQSPGRDGHVRQTPWSMENMEIAFRRNEFAIFPVAGKTRKIEAKSKNRVINAIRGGLLCFCHPTGGYDELDQHCVVGDDLLSEVRRVRAIAKDDPGAVIKMVKGGQDYIRDLYSPKTITEQWKGVFDEVEHRLR